MEERILKAIKEYDKYAIEHQRVADRCAANGDMDGYRRWSEHAAFFRRQSYLLRNGFQADYMGYL